MDKEDLILVHGALGCSSSFDSLTKYLSKDFNLLVPDLRWHGRRSEADSTFFMDDLILDFEDILKNENIQAANVFGFSMGGYVTMSLAIKQPSFFKKIMTLGTKLDWSRQQAEKESKLLDPEKIEHKVPQFAQHLRALHGANWKCLCTQTSHMMLHLGRNPILDPHTVSAIDLPIRLCLGDQDHMVSLEETKTFYSALSKGEMQVYPNCPHPIEKIDAKLVAESMLQFFARK